MLRSVVSIVLSASVLVGFARAQSVAPDQRKYKDRAEYTLYSTITQTEEPTKRLELLNQWEQKYPQSDFNDDRLKYFVATLGILARTDSSTRQLLLAVCGKNMNPE